jgi:hypothetical protein
VDNRGKAFPDYLADAFYGLPWSNHEPAAGIVLRQIEIAFPYLVVKSYVFGFKPVISAIGLSL